jgi:aminopeptidase-like protein
MAKELPIELTHIASGSAVFDWEIPLEWNIKDAYIEGPEGERIVSFSENNLHVVNYSSPVNLTVSLDELLSHTYSLPDRPEWIPYRTSYYHRDWGFCLTHRVKERLKPGAYRVVIDSSLQKGHLSYGETLIPGQVEEEILIYSHICHPSIANDNLSGLAVTTWWAKNLLKSDKPYFSYRFVWGPGTIGSISWLASNKHRMSKIKCVLVAVLLGRPGLFHYKRSRSSDSEVNRVAESVLEELAADSVVLDFDPYGYDERQFCSPGINLSAGRLTRVPNGEYPEYHTSADNLDILSLDSLEESLQVCEAIGIRLEQNRIYENLLPECEPQLGKRGLYRNTGGENPKQRELALLWVLNQSDGYMDILGIAKRAGLPFAVIESAAKDLERSKIIRVVG